MKKRNLLSGLINCLENRNMSKVLFCGIVYVFGLLIEDVDEKIIIEC